MKLHIITAYCAERDSILKARHRWGNWGLYTVLFSSGILRSGMLPPVTHPFSIFDHLDRQEREIWSRKPHGDPGILGYPSIYQWSYFPLVSLDEISSCCICNNLGIHHLGSRVFPPRYHIRFADSDSLRVWYPTLVNSTIMKSTITSWWWIRTFWSILHRWTMCPRSPFVEIYVVCLLPHRGSALSTPDTVPAFD